MHQGTNLGMKVKQVETRQYHSTTAHARNLRTIVRDNYRIKDAQKEKQIGKEQTLLQSQCHNRIIFNLKKKTYICKELTNL